MISVCNKQDVNSAMAESIERDGDLLITMLQSIGTKSGEPVEFSIQRDNGEILGSYQFAMPDKSPIIDDNQLTIDLENTMKTCLDLWGKKYGLLNRLAKSEPSANGTTEMLYIITVKIGSFQFGKSLIEYPRLQITIRAKSCCFPCDIC